jgi:hypothetical protein
MIRQEKQNQLSNPTALKRSHRKIFFIAAVVVAILAVGVVFSVPSLLSPPSVGESMRLSLNYTVGEHMVYRCTAELENQISSSALATPRIINTLNNFTTTVNVLGLENSLYKVNVTVFPQPSANVIIKSNFSTAFDVNTSNYFNYLMAPLGPYVFYDVTNPTLHAYLNQPEIKVGDVWTIPVSSEDNNVSATGEVKMTFRGFQELTVPAGTFRVMQVDIESGPLSLNGNGLTVTIQFHAAAYIEENTCRLIKAKVIQETTQQSSAGTIQTSTGYQEETLVEITIP